MERSNSFSGNPHSDPTYSMFHDYYHENNGYGGSFELSEPRQHFVQQSGPWMNANDGNHTSDQLTTDQFGMRAGGNRSFPSMPSLSEQHVPNQTQFRPPRTVTSKRRAESHNPPETTDSQNPQERVPIGVIYSNGGPGDQFVCSDPTCSGITFNRVPDLKRHHSSLHDRGKQFWCPVDDCSRSKNGNGKPFPRKDKMSDHLEAVHFDRINS